MKKVGLGKKQHMYMAIDLKSFYASVECVERGLDALTTNLVVADESRTSKTICLAVTPSLKAYGLSGRSRLFEVEQKAKEVLRKTGKPLEYLIAPPRMQLYVDYSATIYCIYLKYFSKDDIVVYSIDEVFIDVTDYLQLYEMSARELAQTVIRDILKNTGITATAGIAPNLYLCKVAMDIVAKHIEADEDGVRIAQLDEKEFRQTLWSHKPMTDFWRTGPGTVKRLEKNGMYTMGDVARMSLTNQDFLYKIFGIDAEILIDHAWGMEPCTIADIKAFQPRTNGISSGQVLGCAYDTSKARVVVKEMTDLVVLDLVKKGLKTDSLTLTIGYDRISVDSGEYKGKIKEDRYGRFVPYPAHGTAHLDSYTSSTTKIVDAVLNLYDRIIDENLYVKRITLAANRIVSDAYEQFDLFTDPKQLEREEKIQKAMLEIQNRFGKNAILKGTNLEEGATAIERNGQIGGHKA